MTTLKQNVYVRLCEQAEELKDRGLTKLAENVAASVNREGITFDQQEYSYKELQDDINADLWVAASRFISYYNLDRADVERVQEALVSVASKLSSEMEWALEVDENYRDTLEPKVPGEK